MIRLLSILLFIPFITTAHPGVGIVRNSKGVIFYSDLQQIWKIENGQRSVIIPNVHSHELHIDQNDVLYGEDLDYDGQEFFYHYLWSYSPAGKFDTILPYQRAYVTNDYSLARDAANNEYFIKLNDTSHIYVRSVSGDEKIFASGNFKGVRWLHPQANGEVLYVLENIIYRISKDGQTSVVVKDIADTKPRFEFSGNSITIWGVWQNGKKEVFAAVFSDQAVKKIDVNGRIKEVHHSDEHWAPVHGVFDANGELWVMESSDKNEVRVVKATVHSSEKSAGNISTGLILLVLAIPFLYIVSKKILKNS